MLNEQKLATDMHYHFREVSRLQQLLACLREEISKSPKSMTDESSSLDLSLSASPPKSKSSTGLTLQSKSSESMSDISVSSRSGLFFIFFFVDKI